MDRQSRNANLIGWVLIAIGVLILAPKVPLAVDLISTRFKQDFGQEPQIPEDMPAVSDPYRRRAQP